MSKRPTINTLVADLVTATGLTEAEAMKRVLTAIVSTNGGSYRPSIVGNAVARVAGNPGEFSA